MWSVSIENPEGKRHLGRPKPKWEDDIGVDVKEMGREGVAWINLTQDREK